MVFVVEKDSVFSRLKQSGILEKYSIIMVTGKGFPDLATRRLVAKLSTTLPVLILTDCDVGGLEILCCYKFGAIRNAYSQVTILLLLLLILLSLLPNYIQENLAAPLSWWVGLLPEDLPELSVPLKSFTESDKRKMSLIARRNYVMADPLLRRQVDLMSTLKVKAGLETLTGNQEETYMVETYIPNKIQNLLRQLRQLKNSEE